MTRIFNKMKCLVSTICIAATALSIAPANAEYVQRYAFKMNLQIPRIYNNAESLGYRKYQHQTIRGNMLLSYGSDGILNDIKFTELVNLTHKTANGINVTYDGFLDTSKTIVLAAIGNNRTSVFKKASVCFSLIAEPSYNIGALDEDTSLYVTLAGIGTIKDEKIKSVQGFVVGTLGCGCMAYGHTSPTRRIWWYGISDIVTDVAAVKGTWRISAVR